MGGYPSIDGRAQRVALFVIRQSLLVAIYVDVLGLSRIKVLV
jgi:hypothetical protein